MANEKKKTEVATEEAPKKEKKVAKKAAPKAKKVAKPAKKEKKVEEKAKPVVTEAHAKALGVKCTPRKVRLVLDVVRGKNCSEALELLSLIHKEAAVPVAKLIKSAMANATNNFNMNEDKLYVHEIMASDAIKMKRYLPRAKGSASGMVKRFSNVYVTLKEKE